VLKGVGIVEKSPAYAVTSYASQGKTVDAVVPSYGDGQANQQQWYVAISRAKKRIVILTEDMEALRRQVEQGGSRELALSVMPESELVQSMREAQVGHAAATRHARAQRIAPSQEQQQYTQEIAL